MKKCEKNGLSPRQLKAIELLCTGDYTGREVAKEIKVSENSVSAWMNRNDAFIEEYNRTLDEIAANRKRRYNMKAQRAFDKMVELMNCGLPEIEIKAAKEILDRAGDVAEKQLKVQGVATVQIVDDLGSDDDGD